MRPVPLELRREDFPDLQGERIDRLLRALNAFGASVQKILNRGALVSDNLAAVYRDVTLTTADLPVKFANTLPGGMAPRDIGIARAVELADGGEVPVVLFGPAWKVSGSEVSLSGIGNLSSGKKYRVTLRLIAG